MSTEGFPSEGYDKRLEITARKATIIEPFAFHIDTRFEQPQIWFPAPSIAFLVQHDTVEADSSSSTWSGEEDRCGLLDDSEIHNVLSEQIPLRPLTRDALQEYFAAGIIDSFFEYKTKEYDEIWNYFLNIRIKTGEDQLPIETTEDQENGCLDAVVQIVPQRQREQARVHLSQMLEAARRAGITDPRQLACILETWQHETGFGRRLTEQVPRRIRGDEGKEQEWFQAKYRGDKKVNWPWRLGNVPAIDDPYDFRGCGFIQIIGRSNYEYWAKRSGVDIVSMPDLAASDIELAAKILVEGMRDGTFTGRKLMDYINEKSENYYGARRIVNGIERCQPGRKCACEQDASTGRCKSDENAVDMSNHV